MLNKNLNYPLKILFTGFVTHNVKRFILPKPKGYEFIPGQATEISIRTPRQKTEKNPFTFTSLSQDLVLEFTIKSYPVARFPHHKGMTEALHKLNPGDELIIREPWGTINYQGKGVFLAGGAGITPFIAILRQLHLNNNLAGNKLIFSSKTAKDIILEKEFKNMFAKKDLVLTLTQEKNKDYESGRVGKSMLKKYISDFTQHFYVCGPPKFVAGVKKSLTGLGAKPQDLIFEK
jgi:ferredoxin-NADP reductase